MGYDFTVFKGSKDGSIHQSKTSKPDLQGNQVLVKVTASGLCGTDAHFRQENIVLGHEGIGVVEAVGPQVKGTKVGDRVGWGYEHDCCGRCQQCLKGLETFCPSRAMYGEADLDQGSFAHYAVWKEDFVYHIPDDISDEDAAPLMCAGATVYGALRVYDTSPSERIGIIGVGGLGHLAIQYAAKMGTEVVVFSGSDSKKEEALQLGASKFIATKGKKELQLDTKIDRLLVTTSAPPDWNLLIPCLAPGCVVYPLSVAGGNLEFPYLPFLFQGIRIQGSIIPPRHHHNDMIRFSSLHKIKPIIQKFPMTVEGITDAMEKLNEGKVRYRAVLIPEGK
ncbi:MAG: hypothetical protein M1820_002488 [Bogoriella megaspora]|nr:MAG: hypothetical protein M1820_002488 [Bogoriella megaspora]